MPERDDIVKQALTLAPEDRAFIVDKLEASLSHEGFATPEIAAAWVAEIERRIAAYDRGEVEAIPVETAIERIRARLDEDRRRRRQSDTESG